MEELVEQYTETDMLVQLVRLEENFITPGQARNLVYKFLVKTFCVSLRKGNRCNFQIIDRRVFVRFSRISKDHKEEYTGFQPISKKFKHSSK